MERTDNFGKVQDRRLVLAAQFFLDALLLPCPNLVNVAGAWFKVPESRGVL